MADIVAIYIVLIVAEVEEKKNTLLDFEKKGGPNEEFCRRLSP